jgi:hypothetical protein
MVNVQLPFPFHVVRRAYGNNKGTRSFAFRVDPDSAKNSTRIMQESVRITSELPEYHTREQQRRVAEAMSSGGGKQRSTVLDLYKVLTGEERYVPAKKEYVDDLTRAIDERVSMEQVAMTVQDNGRHRGGKFTDFFRVAKVIVLNEAVLNVPNGREFDQGPHPAGQGQMRRRRPRRAGQTSEYGIRLQFCPSNPFAKTSECCSGLLSVSYTLRM